MTTKDTLIKNLKDKKSRIAVLGLGYVGLPLAVVFGEAGFTTNERRWARPRPGR